MDDYCAPDGDCPPDQTLARRWWLDGVGNWSRALARDPDGANQLDARGTTSFNEYTQAAGATLTYDLSGNLTADGEHQYVWDGLNRLVRVKDMQGATIVTYLYDADGRRVRKDLAGGSAGDIDYALDGWQVVEQYENGASTPKRQFIYGAFINEPVVMQVDTNADGNCTDARYYCHQNTIYSVYALTDENGDIVERYDYDPYGKHILIAGATRTENGTSTIGNPFTFTAHAFDDETGLVYMRMRYYNAAQGRFIGRDSFDI